METRKARRGEYRSQHRQCRRCFSKSPNPHVLASPTSVGNVAFLGVGEEIS